MSHALAKKFGKVVVLMGGLSAERQVSLRSGDAVWRALIAQGIDAHKMDASYQTIPHLLEQKFDRAFIVLHGRWGEDGVMQGALDAINLPYTGSRVLGSALAMDKVRTKQVWQANGLPTAAYRVLKNAADLDGLVDELGLPLFLKPACEGSSIGISKVTSEDQLLDAWQQAAEVGDDVLAEQFIQGPELTVSIVNGKALPIIRLEAANDFYDYEAKYQSDETQYHCPAGLSDQQEQAIGQLAEQAFKALNCSGWGRIDVMLDENQQALLLEANTVPGMTDHSLVPMAAQAAGINFAELVVSILANTLSDAEAI